MKNEPNSSAAALAAGEERRAGKAKNEPNSAGVAEPTAAGAPMLDSRLRGNDESQAGMAGGKMENEPNPEGFPNADCRMPNADQG